MTVKNLRDPRRSGSRCPEKEDRVSSVGADKLPHSGLRAALVGENHGFSNKTFRTSKRTPSRSVSHARDSRQRPQNSLGHQHCTRGSDTTPLQKLTRKTFYKYMI